MVQCVLTNHWIVTAFRLLITQNIRPPTCISVTSDPVATIICRWQTSAKRCIAANVLQTSNVDSQCDKLATELSRQSVASKIANFQLPHLHLTHPTCIWRPRLRLWWPALNFAEIFCVRKLESLDYSAPLFAWFSFSRFSKTLTCDRRIDRHTTTANTRAS